MTESKKPTRSQEVAADVASLLRARNPLIWVVTREEARAERYLVEGAAGSGYNLRTWDVAAGVADAAGRPDPDLAGARDPGDALGAILERSAPDYPKPERCVWVLRDLPAWISGPTGAATLRQVRNLARALPGTARDRAQALVVITPSAEVPPELVGHATVVEWPLPDRDEVAAILDAALEALPDNLRASAAPNGRYAEAVDAAVGLSGEEAAACYAHSLVKLRRVDPALVSSEKKRVIARERVLEISDPLPGGLDAVGGLDQLKRWLKTRATAYSPAARAYGLPAPKGALLVGVPGCGKSLTAKAAATALSCPLVRLDLGALKSKYVGESEGNLRRALRVPETIGRCVLWVDEVEKALAGATDGGADGGVSKDALGTLLSWMQERRGEAFVIATANDVTALPPELMRKGRFDEVFWVDVPTHAERVAVMRASLKTHRREMAEGDLTAVAAVTDGFTGAELASLVPDAMFEAFSDGARELRVDDLVAAAARVVPLTKTAAEKISKLREWARGRARPASTPEGAAEQARPGRVLDIG